MPRIFTGNKPFRCTTYQIPGYHACALGSFLGMNEFNATIIVNRLTQQMMNIWRNFSFDDHSLHEYVKANKMSSHCMEIIKNEIPMRNSFQLNDSDIVLKVLSNWIWAIKSVGLKPFEAHIQMIQRSYTFRMKRQFFLETALMEQQPIHCFISSRLCCCR